ncbi:MAG: Bug family tripartite tricarboxylate transporter substrate binding protein [Burkholderiales bacterium]
MNRIALLLLCALIAAVPSYAQNYPSRPVRMVSPNPHGGANDTVGRIIANKLTEILGQQMVVDNRGGAGGTIGAQIAANANSDGYTLLAASSATHTFSPLIYRKIPYDPVKDFTPVSLFAIAQNLLVANPSLPVKTLNDIIAFAKSKPRALNYSSAGTGSNSHIAITMFVQLAGIRDITVHIPYKGGGPALAATAAGEAHINFGPMPGMVGLVKAGRLKAIAVGGKSRSAALPEVPTAAESGLPGYESTSWFGLMGPAKLPRHVVVQLHKAVVATVQSPDVTQRLIGLGVDPVHSSPEELGRYVTAQIERQRPIVREMGLRAD